MKHRMGPLASFAFLNVTRTLIFMLKVIGLAVQQA